jgi:hypothetical protein
MKGVFLIFILFALRCLPAMAQCESRAIYHHKDLILPSGDTLNKVDGQGRYQGVHVYAENDSFLLSDTIAYIRGYYNHGSPVGKWLVHCKNGDFATGAYAPLLVCSFAYEFEQGIDGKTGIWNFYRKDSSLLKTLRFEIVRLTGGLKQKIYYKNEKGDFVLIKYLYYKVHLSDAIHVIRKVKNYSNEGMMLYKESKTFWEEKTKEYDASGHLKHIWKCEKFLGRRTNRFIFKTYSGNGRLTDRSVTKCPPEDNESGLRQF